MTKRAIRTKNSQPQNDVAIKHLQNHLQTCNFPDIFYFAKFISIKKPFNKVSTEW